MDIIRPYAQEGNPHYIIIPLTLGQFAMVDIDDADLADCKWAMNARYACRRQNGNAILMHRVIMERKLQRPIQDNMIVDHIDNNPLDNRRSNLREATPAQNLWNSEKQKNNSTRYIGVTFQSGIYIARIGGEKKH